MKLLVAVLLLLIVKADEYGVVIDAGSSGSRAFIYKWNNRNYKTIKPDVSIPFTQDGWSIRFKPGFSSCASEEELREHLSKLTNFTDGFFKVK